MHECIGDGQWCCGGINPTATTFAYYDPCTAVGADDARMNGFFELAMNWVVVNYRFTMSYVQFWKREAVAVRKPG